MCVCVFQDWQCRTMAWELRQTLNVVFDLYTTGQNKKGEVKEGDSVIVMQTLILLHTWLF